MRYTDYLKESIKLAGWGYTVIIMIYGILCYLGLMQPTPISIGTIAQAISYIIFVPLWFWWVDPLKK